MWDWILDLYATVVAKIKARRQTQAAADAIKGQAIIDNAVKEQAAMDAAGKKN